MNISLLGHRILLVLSSGAILVSFSEFWFYEVSSDTSYLGLLIAYGLLGYLFLVTLEFFCVSSFNALYLAACMLGFLIEGVLVPVVYSHVPFTIVWTSMAWHALITVVIGWLVFRHVMLCQTWYIKLTFNAGLGVFLGCWNSYIWHVLEQEGTNEIIFNWQSNTTFPWQFLMGFGLFILGHALIGRVDLRAYTVTRFEYWVLWILAIVSSLLVGLSSGQLIVYPVLPLLVSICLWAISRISRSTTFKQQNIRSILRAETLSLRDYFYTLAIPVGAISTYEVLVRNQIGIEFNAILILTAGPLSVWYWVKAIVSAIKAKKRPSHLQNTLDRNRQE